MKVGNVILLAQVLNDVVTASGEIDLTAGQYVEAYVYHTYGSAKDAIGSDAQLTHLEMAYIGI